VPAAAVIPAPIAYIKVVAVKKLVVELWNGGRLTFQRGLGGRRGRNPPLLRGGFPRAAPVRPFGASTGPRVPSYRTLAPALR
jgi:hypothetical protein